MKIPDNVDTGTPIKYYPSLSEMPIPGQIFSVPGSAPGNANLAIHGDLDILVHIPYGSNAYSAFWLLPGEKP